MPKGIPVAAIAIGNAENAGLLAVRILASRDPELYDEYGSLLVLFFLHAEFVVLNGASATVCSRPLVALIGICIASLFWAGLALINSL